MLVLSRRVGDEITLPELGITVRLLSLKGKTARIGVEAPREVAVLRGELAIRSRPEPQPEPLVQPTPALLPAY